MPRVVAPKLNAMLICDYVITEQTTNKKSLIGIFENINAAEFPCVHPCLFVYVKMTEARGSYHIRLELADLQDDKVIAQAKMPNEISIPDPLMAHEIVFSLRGLAFPHAGDYEFRVFANDQIFGQKSFRVTSHKARRK